MSQAVQMLSGIPLFAGLETGEAQEIVRTFQRAAFDAGARIMRQGEPADSAFILESGTSEVVTALPGGGAAKVAELGPGSVLGEMALLESGARSATVIARTPVSGYFIERDDFRMLLAQRNRAAFLIQNRIAQTLCRRLRELNTRIVAADAPENAALALSGAAPGPAGMRRGACSFDYRGFLPLLPFFRRFGATELEALVDQTEVVEIDRGRILFEHGEPGMAAFLVVRGALEIAYARDGHRHRIGLLGPGRLCGVFALIEGQPHTMRAAARENSVLLEIAKPVFDEHFAGQDRLAARFQDAINQELVQALARTNNHLTRLVSQARIRGSRQQRKQADELQRALGEQDCRAANAPA